MITKTVLLAVAALCGIGLVTTASALPVANVSVATVTQIRDHDSGNDIGRRVMRGFEGRSTYRDSRHWDYNRGRGYRDDRRMRRHFD
jgi:hypothetical protein